MCYNLKKLKQFIRPKVKITAKAHRNKTLKVGEHLLFLNDELKLNTLHFKTLKF